MSVRPKALRHDLVGLGLLATLAAWCLLSAHVRGGDARDMVGSLALLASGYLAGRLTASWCWLLAVSSCAALVAWTVLTPGALDGGPLAGPLGYANANGALAVEVAGIALLATARSRRSWAWSVLLLAAALGVLALAWINRSWAALLPGVAVWIVAVAVRARTPRRSRAAVLVAGLLVALAVGGQLAAAAGVGAGQAERLLSQRRVDLWTDAAHLARHEPVFGYGPGSFATKSPTAAADPDTRAAHSELLQAAAEIGVVGAALLLLVTGWAYLALAGAAEAGPAIVGAAAWSAFVLHALMDYVADFPLVVAGAGLVLGLSVGPFAGQMVRTARHRRA